MSRPRPLLRAEQLALDEGVESQDSQAILDALKAEFGAAALHGGLGSPPQGIGEDVGVDVSAGRGADEREERHSEHDLDISSSARGSVRWHDHGFKVGATLCFAAAAPSGEQYAEADGIGKKKPFTSNASDPTAEIHRVGRAAPQTHQPARLRQQDLDDAVVAESSPPRNCDSTNQSHGNSIPTMPVGATRPQMGALDVSQQTPTQVNVERDYDQFYQPVESSSLPDTLHVDDTGAVNFENLSPGARPSSQVSEDAGFENTRGEWRAPAGTSQHRPSSGHTPFKPRDLPPETPVPPKNPFAIQNDANGGVPFAGTQLFEQTPAVASAMKLHSPTSSRPSPAMLPDTMSLNVMGTSPLKARANVSSPTVVHTSSPSRINNIPTSTHKPRVSPIQEESLDKSRELRDDMIPESPTIQPSKRHENRQPLAHYEPMKKSQERKAAVHMPPLQLGIDSDSDDAIVRMRRKKRMNKIRLQTAEEMEKVTVQIPSRRDTGESRNRKRRKLSSSTDELPSTVGGLRSSGKGSSLPGQSLLAESTKATPREDATAPSKNSSKRASSTKPGKSKDDASEEMIPATSPVRSFPSGARHDAPAASEPEPELPVLAKEEPAENDPEVDMQTSSLPPLRRHGQRSYERRAQSGRRSRIITSSETNERASAEPDIQAHKRALPSSSNATVVPARTETTETENPEPRVSKTDSAATIPTAIRTLRRDNKAPLTPVRPRIADQKAHTPSSFTTLSTPVASEKTTPNTPSSPVSDQPEPKAITSSSPAQGRKMRSRISERTSKDKPARQAAKASRTSVRSVLNEPSSTDELQQSPSSSVLESGVSSLRSSRIFKQSIGSTFRGRRLFEGMAFAISMSLDKKNEKTRASIEAKIKQAGGLVLESGFEELFEPSTVMNTYSVPSTDEGELLSLSSSYSNYGFTALIADTHSRKVKYMQALALGLPCIAYQWVVTCLNKGALIDWEPYLLAAGSSAILGNAVRSRCLRPYDAEAARLVEMIDKRPKLLAAEKLLAVVDDKRARSDGKRKKSDLEKQPYLFLAQALGPSISWVSTTQQAREMLDAQDKAGEPFTWIYMDESIGTVESVLAMPELTGKKRRRSQGLPAARNVRVLCDELIVQSLILGRIAEEDEMYDAGVKS
ncbi:hypothetical protein MKX08_001981 [Trichoderma sp. CBMAI-0020]|nr:hypothetical protein MKX08_001981 [Trichoderma sp. CBMAI-0020]